VALNCFAIRIERSEQQQQAIKIKHDSDFSFRLRAHLTEVPHIGGYIGSMGVQQNK
jgi:hypothetical protein